MTNDKCQIRNPKSEIQNPKSRQAFTLVELLVTITVILILAGLGFGALSAARETAKEARTKATIAKLDQALMAKYQSYLTRRVHLLDSSGNQLNTANTSPQLIARYRLDAIRDLMRMEMPDRWNDVIDPPYVYGWGQIPSPPLRSVYAQYRLSVLNPPPACTPAECLYMIVKGIPGALEMFNGTEIGDVDGPPNGLPEFLDGWGHPIYFLRWAPGFTSANRLSDIQSGNPTLDHDPFDSRKVQAGAYKLIPLIYSGGRDGRYLKVPNSTNYAWNFDIATGFDPVANTDIHYSGDPFANMAIGQPVDYHSDGLNYLDNIHNHRIEQR